MPHLGQIVEGVLCASVLYVFWRLRVTERALERHYPKYKRCGWDIRWGWNISAPPRTIHQDGLVYEETDETRARASVDCWGNIKEL